MFFLAAKAKPDGSLIAAIELNPDQVAIVRLRIYGIEFSFNYRDAAQTAIDLRGFEHVVISRQAYDDKFDEHLEKQKQINKPTLQLEHRS